MSFNLSISDVPTHVVVWQDKDSNSALIKSLTERITSLEATVMNLLKKETPLLSGLDVRRGIPPLNIAQETDSRGLFKELIETVGSKPQPLPGNIYEMTSEAIKFVDILPTHEFGTDADADEQDEDVEVDAEGTEETEEVKVEVKKDEQPDEAEDAEQQEAEVEEQQEQEQEADAEQQEDEGEEQEAEDAEEDEEQALELTEFEYKGVTYFRDPENQVYQVDSDGDLDDTPIGLWSEEKQKVLRFAKS
jgi:hypothetical protein